MFILIIMFGDFILEFLFVCLFKFHLTVLSKELKKELWHECVSMQEILLLQPL